MAAAAAATWQPQEGGFKEICGLLEQQISPSSDKSQIWQQLQHYSQYPDFNNYLAFILARAEGKPVEIRQAAGLLLKNNLKTAFKSMPPINQEYIKAELLPCLGAADRQIRSTSGTIISVLVQLGGVLGWPELLHTLVKCLDSSDLTHMEGAMDALSKICEDIPQVLDAENPGSSERPIDVFLPRLLQLFQSPHASLRKLALGSVNQYIMLMPPVLYMSMDSYLQGLFVLANDPSSEVRKLVCSAFVQLIEVRPSFLEPHLRNVIEYMLQVNNDADEEVSLEACEFWSAYCEAPLPPENLRAFLPRLIPVLLSNMAYAEDDESLLDAEEDGSLPDRDQDLKPRCHSSRFHGSDDAKDDDDDIVNIWNLRKCSAAALDIISNVFGDEILPTLMPSVQAKLSKLDDASWKERGAAVLALGAIAEGCINGLYPHLSEIVAFLIPLLDDKFPLIRSISCWTLSRFSKFIVQGIGHPEGLEQFEKVLTGLLRRILDNNKRVQEAACSAFATLEECLHEAGNNQKTTLLDLYHEALDPKLYKKKDSDCFELKSQPQRSSWNHNMNGGYSVKKHKGGFIDHTIRQIRDLPPAALFQLLDKWSKLTDGVTEIHEKVKELQLQEKLENNNLKETATRSRKQTIQKSSKTLNEKAATLMGSITREYMMQPIECIPFHEIVCFTYVNKLQAGLLGDPRKRIQLDLLGSHTFIKCSCCTKSGSFPMSTMHDTTLMYDRIKDSPRMYATLGQLGVLKLYDLSTFVCVNI